MSPSSPSSPSWVAYVESSTSPLGAALENTDNSRSKVTTDNSSSVANSALITPIKTTKQQLKLVKKKQQTQLRLATVKKKEYIIGNNDNKETTKGTLKNAKFESIHQARAEVKAVTGVKVSVSNKNVTIAGKESPVKSKKPTIKWPPVSSIKSLPPLAGRLSDLVREDAQGVQCWEKTDFAAKNTIEFDLNQECTSIAIVPSGRIVVAGFTDGTLRLFDLTGYFHRDKNNPRNLQPFRESFDFDDDASTSTEEEIRDSKSQKCTNSSQFFDTSHSNQRFGAIASRIHARGVHTSLLMDVAVSEDGLYAFGGVQRGSVELIAVYLGEIEDFLDQRFAYGNEEKFNEKEDEKHTCSLLDLIQVDRHADAKLKGFGAVARLWNGWERTKLGERPEYLLFTGKGIKVRLTRLTLSIALPMFEDIGPNVIFLADAACQIMQNIHIWSFKPSRIPEGEECDWTCLYDTQTNGTSISQLFFRHTSTGLQGISKSDDQKLRVWDLSWEEKRVIEGTDGSGRPKRPEYVDVTSTESSIGVCGTYAFALSAASEAIINLIPLDTDEVSSPFNVTELAIPMSDVTVDPSVANRPSRTGRQQRGELKSVVNVTGLIFDASHALLNLSDGSVVHYSHDESGHPVLELCPSVLSKTSIDAEVSCTTASFGLTTIPYQNKKMCLSRIGSQGLVTFAVSSYNENTARGSLLVRALPINLSSTNTHKSIKFWGFNGLKKKRREKIIQLFKSNVNTENRVVSPEVTSLKCTPESELNNDCVDNTPDMILHTEISEDTSTDFVKKVCQDGCENMLLGQSITSNTQLQSTTIECRESITASIPPYIQATQSPMRSDEITVKNIEEISSIKEQRKHDIAEIEICSRSSTPTESALNIPRRRVYQETFSSPALTPSKSNSHTLSIAPLKKIRTDHLGVTLFKEKIEPQLPESCFHEKQYPQLLLHQNFRGTVNERLIDLNLSQPLTLTEPERKNKIFMKHCEERRKLAAKHRAEHEMLRAQVINTIRCVLSSWDIDLSWNKSYTSVLESAKKWFDESLSDHQQSLNEMLSTQQLEAESLSAMQSLELGQEPVPTLQVSFPFPEIFEHAKRELLSFLK